MHCELDLGIPRLADTTCRVPLSVRQYQDAARFLHWDTDARGDEMVLQRAQEASPPAESEACGGESAAAGACQQVALCEPAAATLDARSRYEHAAAALDARSLCEPAASALDAHPKPAATLRLSELAAGALDARSEPCKLAAAPQLSDSVAGALDARNPYKLAVFLFPEPTAARVPIQVTRAALARPRPGRHGTLGAAGDGSQANAFETMSLQIHCALK